MGNHMCAVSCTVTEYSDSVSRRPPMQVIIGYSMPLQLTTPSTAVMCGYGYGHRKRDRNSIEWRTYRAD